MSNLHLCLSSILAGVLAFEATGCIVKTDEGTPAAAGQSSGATTTAIDSFSTSVSSEAAELDTTSSSAVASTSQLTESTKSSQTTQSTQSTSSSLTESESTSSESLDTGATSGTASTSTSTSTATSGKEATPKVDCSKGLDVIQDPVLRNIAFVAMQKPTKEGKPALKLEEVTWLGSPFSFTTIPNAPKIRSLAGLECATALGYIHLRKQSISDLRPLNGLSALNGFAFGGNPASVANLADIPDRWATLSRVELQMFPGQEDVGWLGKLPNLTDLGLFEKGATNRVIEEIARLKREGKSGLEHLYLNGTLVDSLEALEPYAAKFDYLELRTDKPGFLASLKHFVGLRNLRIYGISALNLDFLPQSSQMLGVHFSYSSVENLEGLKKIQNVQSFKNLYLSGNRISDIGVLDRFIGLQELSLQDNPKLSDIRALASLPKLQKLYLSKCSITDLEPLSGLSSLKVLTLSINPNLSDLGPLSSLDRLESLKLAGCSIKDVSPLVDLISRPSAKLKSLDLSDNADICSHPSFAQLKKACDTHKVDLRSGC